MNFSSKILFVSHDSTLTGAPILLLKLVELFKRGGYDVFVLLMRGGELEHEFRKNAATYVLKPSDYQKNVSFPGKIIHYLKYRIRRIRILSALRNVEIVWNNTVANGEMVVYFKKLGIPVVSYIHELESVIDQHKVSSQKTFKFSKLLVSPSGAVTENLLNNHRVERSAIRYLPYYLPPVSGSASVVNDLFQRFQVPQSKFYIVGMGTATYRKGFDLFCEIAREVWKKDHQFFFIWIGGFVDADMKAWFNGVTNEELNNYFLMTGKLPHNVGYFRGMDIFLLTSREDPYPLAVIEAAQMSLPTVYFRGTGGIGDFVGEDCGWNVDKDDIAQCVDLLLDLRGKVVQVGEKGANAMQKAKLIHEVGSSILNSCIGIMDEAK